MSIFYRYSSCIINLSHVIEIVRHKNVLTFTTIPSNYINGFGSAVIGWFSDRDFKIDYPSVEDAEKELNKIMSLVDDAKNK